MLWLVGLYVWQRIDHGINREALEAISEDEDAAAAIGIDVLREKLRVTIISASLTALGGAIYGQYIMYLNPDTVSGIAVSLQIVFAVIAGGVYSMLGPTVGALLTLVVDRRRCACGSAPISSAPPTRSTAFCSFSASSSCRTASSARSSDVRFRRAQRQGGGSGRVIAIPIKASTRRPSSADQ